MWILTVNAGWVPDAEQADAVVATCDLPTGSVGFDWEALAKAVALFGPCDAVGHRIMHGESEFTRMRQWLSDLAH